MDIDRGRTSAKARMRCVCIVARATCRRAGVPSVRVGGRREARRAWARSPERRHGRRLAAARATDTGPHRAAGWLPGARGHSLARADRGRRLLAARGRSGVTGRRAFDGRVLSLADRLLLTSAQSSSAVGAGPFHPASLRIQSRGWQRLRRVRVYKNWMTVHWSIALRRRMGFVGSDPATANTEHNNLHIVSPTFAS